MEGFGISSIRKNAVVGEEESDRADAVLELKKWGYNSWRKIHHYGRRWSVESVFSAIKRIFGETVRATSHEGMIDEVARMIASYNIIMSI